ncbi:MAG: chorismate-binding protein [bacterium]
MNNRITQPSGMAGSDAWNAVLRDLAGKNNYFFLETNMVIHEERRNYLFLEPEEEVCARAPGEVEAAFARIEAGVRGGLYAAGLFSYELGYCLENIFEPPEPDSFPLLWVGLYKKPAVFDVVAGDWAEGCPPRGIQPVPVDAPVPFFELTEPGLSETYPEYEQKINEVKRRIENGDTYQINHTMRLDFFHRGDPIGLYMRLRERQKVAYSGMWRNGEMSALSLSPELFFRVDGGEIETRPMKGTAPPGDETGGDEAAAFIGGDEKNRAENVMIVDLLRNDLGRIAREGTVSAPRLFEIERYETLRQMTSTVRAQLAPEVGVSDLFKSLFPSGSVTGAPKISSMKIIRSLERRPRRIYTGAIGFMAPQMKSAVFNVAIRTVCMNGARGEMGIGGGITYDSTPESEWGEALLKADFLLSGLNDMPARDFSLIETLLWTPDGGFFLLEQHMERMEGSARRFGIVFDERNARAALDSAASGMSAGAGSLRVRLTLSNAGILSVESAAMPASPDNARRRFTISDRTVISTNLFLRHKTTVRKMYDEELAKHSGAGFFDVVFLNEKGELTEGARTNLAARIGGELFTPPAECGLLEGVFRRSLLEAGKARERILYPRDLEDAQAVYLCNSVRGLFEAGYGRPEFLNRQR